MKKGQFIVPEDNRRLHVDYSDYVVYSYDKENFTFEFLFPDYANISGKAVLILKGDNFVRQQYDLDVINQKATLVRVHSKLYQLTEELKERAYSVNKNPVLFLHNK